MKATAKDFSVLSASLSLSVSSVADLFEAVRSSLTWQYGEKDAQSLKGILLQTPTQSLVFFNDKDIAHKLLSQPIIHLSGPLTACFSLVAALPTEFISIQATSDCHFGSLVRDIQAILQNPLVRFPTWPS
jgi:hypothetical protein